jgi:hypothetical protein
LIAGQKGQIAAFESPKISLHLLVDKYLTNELLFVPRKVSVYKISLKKRIFPGIAAGKQRKNGGYSDGP